MALLVVPLPIGGSTGIGSGSMGKGLKMVIIEFFLCERIIKIIIPTNSAISKGLWILGIRIGSARKKSTK